MLALHSTGTGKTLTAAASSRCALESGIGVKQVVMAVKKSTVEAIKRELLRFWPECPLDRYTFVTWETMTMRPESLPNPASTLTIVDEAHVMRNASEDHPALNYARRSRRVLLLTATAVVNELHDVAPLMAALRARPIMSRSEFYDALEARGGYRKLFGGIVGVHLVDQQKSADFPTKVVHPPVKLPMGDETLRRYRQQASLFSPFDHKLRELSLGYGDDCEKCDWLVAQARRWIDKGEGKIVVYSQFNENGGKRLERMFDQQGINCQIIDGTTSAAHRRNVVELFNRPLSEDRKQEPPREIDFKKGEGARCGTPLVTRTLVNPGARHDEPPRYEYEPNDPKKIAYAESLGVEYAPFVEICPENEKLLYVATDGTGKHQYRYTKEWHLQQEVRKFARLRGMDAAFWRKLDAAIARDMGSRDEATATAALAARVMRECFFRPGWAEEEDGGDSDEDDGPAAGRDGADDDRHFGLATLQNQHVRCSKGQCAFRFVGKAGKDNRCVVSDRRLSSLLAAQASRGAGRDRLFGDLRARDLADYLRPSSIRARTSAPSSPTACS